MENVQDELEGLKDLLRSDVYTLDQNALLDVSLRLLYAQGEETNYEDICGTSAGSNEIPNSNVNTFSNDFEQTRCQILKFVHELQSTDFD